MNFRERNMRIFANEAIGWSIHVNCKECAHLAALLGETLFLGWSDIAQSLLLISTLTAPSDSPKKHLAA